MENSITIQTKTSAEDYKALVFFNMYLKKKITFYFMIVAAVLSFAASAAKLAGVVEISDWYFYVCLAFLGLVVLQYGLFLFSVKQFLKSDQLIVDNTRTITVSESGIEEVGGRANSAGSYQWKVFYNGYETKNYYYLYINTMQAIILPKKEFDQNQNEVLRDLFSKKLGRKFHKR